MGCAASAGLALLANFANMQQICVCNKDRCLLACISLKDQSQYCLYWQSEPCLVGTGVETAQVQRLQETPDEEASEEGDQEGDMEVDESVAQTEAALAGAQEAQQQAVQAQQQALAEERRDLMQLRQHLQQQSGQPAQCLRHTAYFRAHIVITSRVLLKDFHAYKQSQCICTLTSSLQVLQWQWQDSGRSLLTCAAHA